MRVQVFRTAEVESDHVKIEAAETSMKVSLTSDTSSAAQAVPERLYLSNRRATELRDALSEALKLNLLTETKQELPEEETE